MTPDGLLQKIILGEITVSQGLMFCKVLFKDLLKKESYQWVCNELGHNDDIELLPNYRILDCDIMVIINGYYGRGEEILDTSILNEGLEESEKPFKSPNKMLVRQNIESIEQSLKTEATTVKMELKREQVDLLMQCCTCSPGYRVEKMYQECRIELLRNIIPCVRNRLVSVLQTEVLPQTQKQEDAGVRGDKKIVFISY